jgi:cation diffusion facilitator CzcD-associated flavoprotein CzcO
MLNGYSTEQIDLLIVGAGTAVFSFFFSTNEQKGPHGLSVASTYHTLHPSSPFLILDSALSLGGVWASERLYNDLYTNNRFGTYEFPDFKMDAKKLGMEGTGHIPGSVVHDYLQAYAEEKDLIHFMRLDTKVMSIESL